MLRTVILRVIAPTSHRPLVWQSPDRTELESSSNTRPEFVVSPALFLISPFVLSFPGFVDVGFLETGFHCAALKA